MNKSLLEIRIYGILLFLVIFTYFLASSIMFQGGLRVFRCNSTPIENVNQTVESIEYLNDDYPEFVLSTPRAEITAEMYTNTSLICSGNHDIELCSFTNPLRKIYTFNSKYYADEKGRIRSIKNNTDCGIFIAAVKPTDEGKWHCNVTAKYGGRFHVGHNTIQLKTFYREDFLNSSSFEYL